VVQEDPEVEWVAQPAAKEECNKGYCVEFQL
jgi:hypothetical protein